MSCKLLQHVYATLEFGWKTNNNFVGDGRDKGGNKKWGQIYGWPRKRI